MTLEQFEIEYRPLALGWSHVCCSKRGRADQAGHPEKCGQHIGTADTAMLLEKTAALRVEISGSLGNKATTAACLVEPFGTNSNAFEYGGEPTVR